MVEVPLEIMDGFSENFYVEESHVSSTDIHASSGAYSTSNVSYTSTEIFGDKQMTGLSHEILEDYETQMGHCDVRTSSNSCLEIGDAQAENTESSEFSLVMGDVQYVAEEQEKSFESNKLKEMTTSDLAVSNVIKSDILLDEKAFPLADRKPQDANDGADEITEDQNQMNQSVDCEESVVKFYNDNDFVEGNDPSSLEKDRISVENESTLFRLHNEESIANQGKIEVSKEFSTNESTDLYIEPGEGIHESKITQEVLETTQQEYGVSAVVQSDEKRKNMEEIRHEDGVIDIICDSEGNLNGVHSPLDFETQTEQSGQIDISTDLNIPAEVVGAITIDEPDYTSNIDSEMARLETEHCLLTKDVAEEIRVDKNTFTDGENVVITTTVSVESNMEEVQPWSQPVSIVSHDISSNEEDVIDSQINSICITCDDNYQEVDDGKKDDAEVSCETLEHIEVEDGVKGDGGAEVSTSETTIVVETSTIPIIVTSEEDTEQQREAVEDVEDETKGEVVAEIEAEKEVKTEEEPTPEAETEAEAEEKAAPEAEIEAEEEAKSEETTAEIEVEVQAEGEARTEETTPEAELEAEADTVTVERTEVLSETTSDSDSTTIVTRTVTTTIVTEGSDVVDTKSEIVDVFTGNDYDKEEQSVAQEVSVSESHENKVMETEEDSLDACTSNRDEEEESEAAQEASTCESEHESAEVKDTEIELEKDDSKDEKPEAEEGQKTINVETFVVSTLAEDVPNVGGSEIDSVVGESESHECAGIDQDPVETESSIREIEETSGVVEHTETETKTEIITTTSATTSQTVVETESVKVEGDEVVTVITTTTTTELKTNPEINQSVEPVIEEQSHVSPMISEENNTTTTIVVTTVQHSDAEKEEAESESCEKQEEGGVVEDKEVILGKQEEMEGTEESEEKTGKEDEPLLAHQPAEIQVEQKPDHIDNKKDSREENDGARDTSNLLTDKPLKEDDDCSCCVVM